MWPCKRATAILTYFQKTNTMTIVATGVCATVTSTARKCTIIRVIRTFRTRLKLFDFSFELLKGGIIKP